MSHSSPDGWYRVACKRYVCGMTIASGIVADAGAMIRRHLGLPAAEAVAKLRQQDPDIKITRRGDLEQL